MSRSRADTMPTVTVPPSPNGLPIAITQSPIRMRSESPNSTSVSFFLAGSTRSTARSVLVSRPTSSAFSFEPSEKFTSISSASAITWLLVTMMPSSASMMKPEPSAVARTKQEQPEDDAVAGGVTIDISRRRVHIDGEVATLTFKEFELLQYLVLREGRTIERTELVSSLWSHADGDEAPGERTIDVHVRRLRSKLGRYEDIVRTVRGVGYRFDRHADVVIRYGHGTPSPDRF